MSNKHGKRARLREQARTIKMLRETVDELISRPVFSPAARPARGPQALTSGCRVVVVRSVDPHLVGRVGVLLDFDMQGRANVILDADHADLSVEKRGERREVCITHLRHESVTP